MPMCICRVGFSYNNLRVISSNKKNVKTKYVLPYRKSFKSFGIQENWSNTTSVSRNKALSFCVFFL
jgi:hypothetical protein